VHATASAVGIDGQKEVSDGLVSPMARQCLLTHKPFAGLQDCPFDRDAYEAELRKQGGLC
jgi:hypothetical protein